MYSRLFDRLGLDINQSEVSQSVALGDNNTAVCECVVFSGDVKIEYQQSNDLENWTTAGAASGALTAPYNLVGSQVITCDYLRIKCTENSGFGTAVVSYGVNLSAQ